MYGIRRVARGDRKEKLCERACAGRFVKLRIETDRMPYIPYSYIKCNEAMRQLG